MKAKRLLEKISITNVGTQKNYISVGLIKFIIEQYLLYYGCINVVFKIKPMSKLQYCMFLLLVINEKNLNKYNNG